MEQKTPSGQDAGATRRRMRMLRELEAYGIPPDVVVAALKLAAALAVGALAVPLAALLLVSHTDSVAKQQPAEGEVSVEFVTLPDGASPSGRLVLLHAGCPCVESSLENAEWHSTMLENLVMEFS